jgi:hypothetical protein
VLFSSNRRTGDKVVADRKKDMKSWIDARVKIQKRDDVHLREESLRGSSVGNTGDVFRDSEEGPLERALIAYPIGSPAWVGRSGVSYPSRVVEIFA